MEQKGAVWICFLPGPASHRTICLWVVLNILTSNSQLDKTDYRSAGTIFLSFQSLLLGLLSLSLILTDYAAKQWFWATTLILWAVGKWFMCWAGGSSPHAARRGSLKPACLWPLKLLASLLLCFIVPYYFFLKCFCFSNLGIVPKNTLLA